ncbi:hypothetical protein Csa_021280 [Cucumis sativus]|nr:hypothetical protein Csa_021280 [Cucumis sativus]
MAYEDKFDVLPDALLSIIVSSLPFKEAVRTSILSKRWMKIWQATKNIELHECFFVQRDDYSDQQTIDAQRRAFIDFVTNFIRIYQESSVSKFCLSVSNPSIVVALVDECIRFAISRNVKTLELDFSDGENELETTFSLPPIVYEHENLESLKLFGCGFKGVELEKVTNLREFCVGWMEVRIGEIRELVKKCGKLESFSMKNCWNVTHFEIGGNDDDELRLKSLEIENCRFVHDWISIEAPKLSYFRYFGTVGIFRMEVNKGCFEEADLGFEIDDDDDHSEMANLLYVLLDGLYPARVFTVCSSLLQDYEPPFPMDIGSFWATNMILITCLSTSLETVEVKGFTGKQHEIPFLAYLIHYGKLIKTLSIDIDSHDIANTQIYFEKAQILKTIKPASKKIHIHIS